MLQILFTGRLSEEIDLVANFAAIHREPGHEDHEYYRCNLLGAENVCDWAEKIGCQKLYLPVQYLRTAKVKL